MFTFLLFLPKKSPLFSLVLLIFLPLNALSEDNSNPCPPPKNYDLYSGLKFIGWSCTSASVSCPDVAATNDSACEKVCNDPYETVANGIPGGEKTIGIIFPDGRISRWPASQGMQVVVSEDETGRSRLYDQKTYKYVPQAVTPNGEVIRVTEDYELLVFSPPKDDHSVIASKPNADSRTSPNDSNAGETLKPEPKLLVNGSEAIEHQLFVNDVESFTIELKNELNKDKQNEPIDPCALPSIPKVSPLSVEIKIDSTNNFFQGLDEESFELPGGESRMWTLKPVQLLQMISQYDEDILYGARVSFKAWAVESPGTLLIDEQINVYRLLDAADDTHDDGALELARTLGDGPEKVFRKRPLLLEMPESAEVEIFPNTKEFSFIKDQSSNYFKFDPSQTDERISSHYQFRLRAMTDGKHVGVLPVRGKAEAQNYIKTNIHQLSKTLQRIAVLTADTSRAGKTPPDHKVHPAYIPPIEAVHFNSSSKAEELAGQLEAKMAGVYGELFKGIKWVKSAKGQNTVNILWELRDNRHPNAPWAFGRAFDDINDPNKIDNWNEIVQIIEQEETWNKGEFAFRLSKAINPSLVKNVTLYPDSMLENHKGFGDNKIALTKAQILNAFAKTTIHEIAHSMSLKHPIQVGTRSAEQTEYQLLTIAPGSSSQRFRLKLHGDLTEDISFEETGLKLSIWQALQKLKTIGYSNMSASNPEGLGVFVKRCSNVNSSEPDSNTKETCAGVLNPSRSFSLSFANHLDGIDIEDLEIVPTSAGQLSTKFTGKTNRPIKTSASGVLGKINVPGNVDGDIMYGGFNDIDGELRFQPGVSLEIMKMALALDYTPEEIEKAATTYKAIIDQTKAFGGSF